MILDNSTGLLHSVPLGFAIYLRSWNIYSSNSIGHSVCRCCSLFIGRYTAASIRLNQVTARCCPCIFLFEGVNSCLEYKFKAALRDFQSFSKMPPAKLKPSDIAGEAKRTYIPYIEQKFPEYPVRSYLYPDSSKLRIPAASVSARKLRVAVIDGDPVDVALDWNECNNRDASMIGSRFENGPIPVVNMANEKRAGGDWESGLIAPEECLCRRSNLVHTLTMSASQASHYPIPTTGGIYSPHVGTEMHQPSILGGPWLT